MTTKNTHNKGFTLVELSIVLVIIGLIIGGVLSGRQIMLNAQITNAVNSIQAYEAQFQTYVQNYSAIPGDDDKATARFSNASIPAKASASDGTLDGDFDASTDGVETRLLWAHLRGAGLVKGSGSNQSQPANPFGGIYGFQHGAFSGTSAYFTTNVLCLSSVPGDAAMSIDSRLDDGVRDKGAVMAGDSANTTTGLVDGDTYDAAATYALCVKM